MTHAVIDLDEFATIFYELVSHKQDECGSFLRTSGMHPKLGPIAMFQGIGSDVLLVKDDARLPSQGSPWTAIFGAAARWVAERQNARQQVS